METKFSSHLPRVTFRFYGSRTFSVAKQPQVANLPEDEYLEVISFILPTAPGTGTTETKGASALVRRQRHGSHSRRDRAFPEEGVACGGQRRISEPARLSPRRQCSAPPSRSGPLPSPVTHPRKPPATPLSSSRRSNRSTRLVQRKVGARGLGTPTVGRAAVPFRPATTPLSRGEHRSPEKAGGATVRW